MLVDVTFHRLRRHPWLHYPSSGKNKNILIGKFGHNRYLKHSLQKVILDNFDTKENHKLIPKVDRQSILYQPIGRATQQSQVQERSNHPDTPLSNANRESVIHSQKMDQNNAHDQKTLGGQPLQDSTYCFSTAHSLQSSVVF